MEELNSTRNYQYGKLSQHTFDLTDKSKFTLQSNGNQLQLPKTMENETNGRSSRLSSNGSFGGTCRVSLVSLKRVGSAISFIPSRKSSTKSVTSKTSSESNKSQVRKNSGQFDGCNSRVRKHSNGCKISTSSQSRKISTNSQRDQIIAEIYRELEQLKEFEFSSSSEDEDDDNNNKKDREDLERQKRVELYVEEHSRIYKKVPFYIDSENESTNNNQSSDSDEIAGVAVVNNNNDNTHVINIEHENITETSKMKLPIIKVKKHKKRYSTMINDVDDGFYSTHTQMTSNRLTKLFLDNNRRINVNDSFHIVPKGEEKHMQSRKITHATHNYLQVPEAMSRRFHRGATPRGSINSVSSFNSTLSNSDSVPMNFIPGQTKPIPRENRSNSLSFNYIQKAKFCFKGVMCQIDKSTPKTFKAMAHAGMLSISIIGPSDHRCSH